MPRIQLGQIVRCFVTDIVGKATVISEELNGNRRISVQQSVKDDGTLPESYFHDENEVEYIGPGVSDRVVLAPESDIVLGAEYRDRVTGFLGIATSRNTYISGCLRFILTAKVTTGIVGKIIGGKVDPAQLLVPHDQLEPVQKVKPQAEPKPEVAVEKTRVGGPMTRSNAMRRR